jgi:hypothetical protein
VSGHHAAVAVDSNRCLSEYDVNYDVCTP